MATNFDRWEKDPFFSAAEEVQESAERMESAYRTWNHARKDASSLWNSEELRRDLLTALGTTKWQLEVFERAVASSYAKRSNDDARDRHREFIVATEDHVSKIENSLKESAVSEGKPPQPWVRLDQGECDELALFLAGPVTSGDRVILKRPDADIEAAQELGEALANDCSAKHLAERGSAEAREERSQGHRRTASAGADIGAWKIAIAEDGSLQNFNVGQAQRPPKKTPSWSVIFGNIDSAPKFNWPKNGVRKWKATDRHQESDTAPLQSSQLSRGIDACYEKSKSCLDSYDECYNKQLYGWYGAIQRQLQRSQYQVQYSRPVQAVFSIVLILCLIGE
ncbi:hypothetical protein Tsubulata_036134 [Turnera subulata]|uniref:Syntaxin 6/10/61 N-terminal domain-containing protein n=1 Tax=Turnera subulata TaxID=218843 RepID=A0A9Q0J5R8_9ROSI|nr:hypothetical protein Tsubulata_036134 [Turnera subulata]